MANAIYANARAKALENYLLGADRLNRMIDSGSAEEGIKILSEVNFGEGVLIDSFLGFEKLISAEEKNLINFIKDTCPNKAFCEYFLLPFDYHNAEAFIKEKYKKTDSSKMTVESGIYDKDAMRDKIMLDEYKDFTEELGRALLYCDGEFVANRATGETVSAAFKKALYNDLNRLSKKNADLKEIFSVKADCANIGVALRFRNFSQAKQNFISGGNISDSDLKLLCEESFDVLKEKCKFFKNGDLAALAVENAGKGEPLSEFEKAADDFALKYLKKKKYSTDGLVPFMLYCYYKKAELNNVRIIMVGLINGLEKSDIKRRLRDTYER